MIRTTVTTLWVHGARPPRGRLGRSSRRRIGITLLEVILALGLLGILLGMLFIFTETSMKAEATGRELATRSQLARVVLDRIAKEVRQAAAFGTAISGDENSIRILTTVLPDREIFERRRTSERPRPAEYDLVELRYYLKIYEDEYVELEDGTEVPAVAGLYRREWKVLGHEGRSSLVQGVSALPQAVKITVGYKELELEPVYETENEDVIDLNPGVEEPFAPEIKCLRLRYHDGKNWVDRWAYREDESEEDEEEGEASVVSQTRVSWDDEDEEDEKYHPDRYTVIVRLTQSDELALGSKLQSLTDELREQFGDLETLLGGGMGGDVDLSQFGL